MRAVLGYDLKNASQPITTYISEYCSDIPAALQLLKDVAGENDILISEKTVLVFPLDSRHNLAWVVKETADKGGYGFSRNIPDDAYPPLDVPISEEIFSTGSGEDELSLEVAKERIIAFNNEGREYFQDAEFGEAMGYVRHALQLALKYFDWQSPIVAYTLLNLASTLRLTGNPENAREARALIQRMNYVLNIKRPQKDDWDDSAIHLLDIIANECQNLGDDSLSESISKIADDLR